MTGTAIYNFSVDSFDSQPILKSKPSGVWKLFEGIRTVNLGKRTVNLGKRTVNLGKRKRTNVNNFKSHSPLSPQSGPGIFFSLTINSQPLNNPECVPSSDVCSSDFGLTTPWTDHDVKHAVDDIDYLRRTGDMDHVFKLSPTKFSNNDLSVFNDR